MDEIKRLHESMGIRYPLPNLESPLIAVKALVRNCENEVIGACAVKLFGEAFLWLDLKRSPRERISTIRTLSRVATNQAKKLGLDEVSCWVPPQIEGQFAHMLTNLGWIKSPWPSWSRIL